jgi:hypothetical protein
LISFALPAQAKARKALALAPREPWIQQPASPDQSLPMVTVHSASLKIPAAAAVVAPAAERKLVAAEAALLVY